MTPDQLFSAVAARIMLYGDPENRGFLLEAAGGVRYDSHCIAEGGQPYHCQIERIISHEVWIERVGGWVKEPNRESNGGLAATLLRLIEEGF